MARVLILLVFFLAATDLCSAKALVVLEAAHGGVDPGLKIGGEVEKEWTLRFSKAIEKALVAEGLEVVLVRKGDEALSEEKRAEIINSSQASAVLVIHAERRRGGWQKVPFLDVEPPNLSAEPQDASRFGAIPPSLFRSSLKLARSLARNLGMGTDLASLTDGRSVFGEGISSEGRIYCLPHQSLRYLCLPAVVLSPMALDSSEDKKRYSSSDEISALAQKVAKGIAGFLQ